MAFVGRPNTGKSTLQNKFLKENRLIVSSISGTTRDSISSEFEFEGTKFVFTDTPGIRRPGAANREHLSKISTQRAKRSIEKSDISVLLLDGIEGVAHQDLAIANLIIEAKKGFIIAVNKWDLEDKGEEKMKRFLGILRARFAFAKWMPAVFISAKTGKNINHILALAEEIFEERKKRIPTAELNKFLAEVIISCPPKSKKIPKFFYATQVDISPPHFIFFVNNPSSFHFSYRRFLENRIREKYGFNGTGILLDFKPRKNE